MRLRRERIRASSNKSRPLGAMISPLGPMLPATRTLRPTASAPARAMRAAAVFSSATRFESSSSAISTGTPGYGGERG
jgi:hypothetical protein